MKYLLICWVVFVSAGFYFYSKVPHKYVTEQVPAGVDEMQWRRGRAIYKARCTSCHNSNPELHGPVGPALRGITESVLVDRLTNGKGAMPPQPDALRFSKALREYLK